MKKSNKNHEKLGWLVMMVGVVFSGSSVHFQIWKYLHFQMKNSSKIWEKSEKNREVTIIGCCCQGPV